jgi:hypothetical protein
VGGGTPGESAINSITKGDDEKKRREGGSENFI